MVCKCRDIYGVRQSLLQSSCRYHLDDWRGNSNTMLTRFPKWGDRLLQCIKATKMILCGLGRCSVGKTLVLQV